jgi:hypothetical protein
MNPGDLVTPLDERVDLWPTHSGKIRSYPVSSPFNYGEVGTVLEVVEDDNNAFSTMKRNWWKILSPSGVGWCSPQLVNLKLIDCGNHETR